MSSPNVLRLSLLALLGAAGCYTAELDPTIGDAFVCAVQVDCPSGLRCVNSVCEREDELPSVTIIGPEEGEAFDTDAPLTPGGTPPEMATMEVSVLMQGILELTPAGGEHVFGQGHVVLEVDGQDGIVIDSGSIAASIVVPVELENVTGPHRIALRAVRNDGVPYDNTEATATRLFWLVNEALDENRPFVAVRSPWPGTEVPLEATEIEVEVSVFDFEMLDPGSSPQSGRGHAHFYHDVPLPECALDEDCDDDRYLGAIQGSSIASFVLPPAEAAGSQEIGVALRHIDHDLYGHPFGCDPVAEPDICQVIVDTIEINRVAN